MPATKIFGIIPLSPVEKMVNGQKCLSARVRVIRDSFFFIRVIRAIRGCLLVAADGRAKSFVDEFRPDLEMMNHKGHEEYNGKKTPC